MFFYISKYFWIIAAPLNFLALCLLIGCLLILAKKTHALAKRLIAISVISFLILGFVPIGKNLLVFLETRHDIPSNQNISNMEGIIILGGCIHPKMSDHYKYPVIIDSCERITQGLTLLNTYPNKKLIFTGGSGQVSSQNFKEADIAKMLFSNLNINMETIYFENQSKNTFENALLTKELLNKNQQLNKDGKWLLITSAFHMPRASRLFCAQDIDILSYPTDHRTYGRYNFTPNLDVLGNFTALHTASKEIIGFIVYWITGKFSLSACQTPLL